MFSSKTDKWLKHIYFAITGVQIQKIIVSLISVIISITINKSERLPLLFANIIKISIKSFMIP